jgi:hypothetical protein
MTRSAYSMPFWLWIGIIGLVLSIAIPAIIGMVRKPKKTPDTSEKLVEEFAKIADDVKRAGAQGALLFQFNDEAVHLERILVAAWHECDAVGVKLVHPLSENPWRDTKSDAFIPFVKGLNDFYSQYASHVEWLKICSPGFASRTITRGYPSEDPYYDVLDDLQSHSAKLKETAERIWKSESPEEVLNAKTT